MDDHNGRNVAGLAGGAILILLGVTFLLAQALSINLWRFGWPLFIIGPGLLFFVAMFAGGRSLAPLAIPGSIITTVGLILAFQNLSGLFQTWAYAWALIIVAVGVGMVIQGAWAGQSEPRRNGAGVIKVGLIQFVIWGAFFELLIGLSGRALPSYFWPALLIVAGVALLFRAGRRTQVEPVSGEDPFSPEPEERVQSP